MGDGIDTGAWAPLKYKIRHETGAYALLEYSERTHEWTWDVYDAESFRVATDGSAGLDRARGDAEIALDRHVATMRAKGVYR